MEVLTVRTKSGGDVHVTPTELRSFAESLNGRVLVSGADGYETARAVWNAMVDRRPAMIVRCSTQSDIVRAVRFAGARELLIAVRGGGHNIAGTAVCDGGVVIDLSGMRSVHVDPGSRTARVEPGCTLADVDRAAQTFGLATPLGINSTTGVAGLTLGGGFGWLSRRYGMTVDNLLAASVVTADGELVQASDIENPDLFWAIRGGGGNFGVVTSFEFRLHPVGPEVTAGLIVHSLEAGPELLRRYRDLTATAPDDLSVWIVLRFAPPLPFLPEPWHGRPVVVLAVCHVGDPASAEHALKPFRQLGEPVAEVIGTNRFTEWQQAFDPLLTPGARNYWKSHDFLSLSDEALDTIVRYAERLPTPESEIFIAQVGGAITRVPADATAYPHRDVNFVLNVHTRWREASDDDRCVAWAREFFEATAPHASGGVYVNFMTDDEASRLSAAYGPNHARLAELKKRYDPGNLFSVNQNIAPVSVDAVLDAP